MIKHTKSSELVQTVNISCIDNLVLESKKLLEAVHTLHKKIGSNKKRLDIIVRTSDKKGNKKHILLYQKNKYIILVPEGKKQHALMYGTWEEALHATKRRLVTEVKELRVFIDQYLTA